MTPRIIALFISLLILSSCCPKRDNSKSNQLSGPYLGQTPPEDKPEIFAPGILSNQFHLHSSPAISAEGSEIFYSIGGVPYKVITTIKEVDGVWTDPQVASFSGKYIDDHPMFSPDGSRVYFDSRRPADNSGAPEAKSDIWYVEKTASGWSDAKPIGIPVNHEGHDMHPSVAANGNIYFASGRPDSRGSLDIYCSEVIEGVYQLPYNMGDSINSSALEAWLFVDPEERYLLFSSFDRKDDPLPGGLYISFKNENGNWSKAKNLGTEINGLGTVRMPLVSPDGKYLFFNVQKELPMFSEQPLDYEKLVKIKTTWHNGQGNIYWMKADIIGNMRKD